MNPEKRYEVEVAIQSKVKIEINEKELSLLLRVLGKEKARLNEGGYFASAHEVSTLLSQLRSGAFDQIEVTH
jgi:predicted metalloprotease